MKKRGVLDETALALAEATWADPSLAAAALLVSTVLVRDVWWDVGATFLAGAALRGTSWKLRWPLLVAVAAMWWHLDPPFSAGWSLDRLADSTRLASPIRVGLLLGVTGAGLRSWKLPVLGVATGLVAWVLRREKPDVAMLIAAAAAVAALVLGARRRPRVGIAVATTTLVGLLVERGWDANSGEAASYVPAVGRDLVLAAWPAVAGLCALSRDDVGSRPESARLFILAQRRPVVAVTIAAAFVLFCCLNVRLPGDKGSTEEELSLCAMTFGASLLANVAVSSRSPLGFLATATWTTGVVYVQWALGGASTTLGAWRLAWGAIATLWPVVVVYLFRRSPSDRVARRLLIALAATPLPVIFVAACFGSVVTVLFATLWGWLVAAPVAFQIATALQASPRRIVAASAAFGAASVLPGGVLLLTADLPSWFHPSILDVLGRVLVVAGVSALAGVYVVLARRARSLCAVELDAAS